jgi:hypothetical protein
LYVFQVCGVAHNINQLVAWELVAVIVAVFVFLHRQLVMLSKCGVKEAAVVEVAVAVTVR